MSASPTSGRASVADETAARTGQPRELAGGGTGDGTKHGAGADGDRRGRSDSSPVVTRTPGFTIWLSGSAGVGLTLAGCFGVAMSLLEVSGGSATPTVWWTLVFQSIVAVCGVFPVLLALGYFRSGPVLTMMSSGVCALVTLPLMEPNIVFALLGRGGNSPEIGGVALIVIAGVSAAPAAVLCLMGALATFLRAPLATVPRFVVGSVFLAAPAAAYGLVGVPTSPFGSGAGGAALTAVAATLAFALLLAVISVGVHLVARSIEIGIDAGSPERVG